MLNDIRELLKLQKKLEQEHGIIDVSESFEEIKIHVFGTENFMRLSGDRDVMVELVDEEYKASFVEAHMTFFCFISDKEEIEEVVNDEKIRINSGGI